MEELAEYNFRIKHIAGEKNVRADALSRRLGEKGTENEPLRSKAFFRAEGNSLLFNSPAVSIIQKIENSITNEFKKAYDKDSIAKQQRQELQEGFSWGPQQVLLYKGRIYIPTGIRKEFIAEQHSLPANGYKGIGKTFDLIAREYYFPGLRKMVKDTVLGCHVCIQNKGSNYSPYGKMKSPDTPKIPWKSIAMDFVVKLPLSRDPWTKIQYDSVFVVVCRLTKEAHIILYKEASTAEDLANIFIREIYSHHGMPDEIISDRDKLFISRFWASFTGKLGIKRKLSTSFYPQTDGQTERTNQTMESYLRCYVNYKQDDWVELLPLAQFAFNNSEAETTGVSPFFANKGFNPSAYGKPLPGSVQAEEAMIKTEDLTKLHNELKTDIEFINKRSALYYDKGRSVGPTLGEGDKVYLLRKNIRTKRPSDKLDHKRLGPFKIQKKVGPVNFRLQLPRTMNIHPVFHISLLEKAPPGAPAAPMIEIEPVNPETEYEVESILDHKLVRGSVRYLIKWKGYPHSENS